MPKGSSGIKRGSKVKMSFEDAVRKQRLEENLREADRMIPSYLNEGMNVDEIRSAVMEKLREESKEVQIGDSSYSKLDVDGTYPKPKNSRFDVLVDGLNMTQVTEYEDDLYSTIERRVERLTAGYSTKELREFRESELGERIDFWKGRSGHVRIITLDLYHRFNDPNTGSNAVARTKISAPSIRLTRGISSVRQAINNRKIWRSQLSEIQAKYRKGKG